MQISRTDTKMTLNCKNIAVHKSINNFFSVIKLRSDNLLHIRETRTMLTEYVHKKTISIELNYMFFNASMNMKLLKINKLFIHKRVLADN